MGIPRSKRRDLNGEVNLYTDGTSLGCRVIRQVSQAEAVEKLPSGEWREVCDEHGNFWGCQVLVNFKKNEDLPSRATSPAITVRECMLNAGLCGQSRTAGMTEEQRISRKSPWGRPLPPEDAIERGQAKVAEWGSGCRRITRMVELASLTLRPRWHMIAGEPVLISPNAPMGTETIEPQRRNVARVA